ncbi:MAG: HlyD family efflux transporter periplasmic adaptor subunit [Defluviitaleaceae bacterium]|nr:HlyD family efflux transporter periplasmic adaptor subunit [Defluviitaleaceae bacterium]
MENLKKTRWIRLVALFGAIVTVVVIGIFMWNRLADNDPPRANVTLLLRQDLTETVPLRGAVQSQNSRNVAAVLNLPVREVLANVGDEVYEGQVLAVLDTTDLELNIAQQRAEISAFEQTSTLNLENARQLHTDAQSALNTGQNPQIMAAQSAVNNALLAVENAVRNRDNALEAQNAQDLLGDFVNLAQTVANAQMQVDVAHQNHQSAVMALDVAFIAAEAEIARLSQAVLQAEIAIENDSRMIALMRLERQLAESEIRAPIDGTITFVRADVGNIAAGVMFVIEDTQNLMITTSIREYDAASVAVGMLVEIRIDAVTDAIFNGFVSFIDPTATRSMQGDVEFGAEIAVTSYTPQLRIGMNTRLNVILQESRDTFAVSFDAVWRDDNDDWYVFVAEGEGSTRTARQMPVTIGISGDFMVEIISDELTSGMLIINNAANVVDGMQILIN